MKGDVRVGVVVDVFGGRAAVEAFEHRAQRRDLLVGRALGRETRRHAFERSPQVDHLDDLAARLAHDVDAAPRHRAQKPSCSSRVIASRTGVRLTPSAIVSFFSSRRISCDVPPDVRIGDSLAQPQIGLLSQRRTRVDRLELAGDVEAGNFRAFIINLCHVVYLSGDRLSPFAPHLPAGRAGATSCLAPAAALSRPDDDAGLAAGQCIEA